MNLAGEVDRTFTVDGVPAGRVGHAQVLDLQANAYGRLFHRHSDDARGGLPGGAAGGAAKDLHRFNLAVNRRDLEFRAAEMTTVPPQTSLPGKAASGGRRQRLRNLLAGGHHRYALLAGHARQVGGKIGVFKEIQD